MLKKRVIFTLLYDRGSFMLSRNFRLQKVGDLRWLQKNYNFSNVSFSIDELIILDVSRGERDPERFCEHVKAMTDGCFVPIAAGGGVRTLDQAWKLLRSGADKVTINSLIGADHGAIAEMASAFGAQCLVVSVDAKLIEGKFIVFTDNGAVSTGIELHAWLDHIARLPVGEIYLNSMDRDGTGQGYILDLLAHIPSSLTVPIILAGGAGKPMHLEEGLKDPRVDAVATAHLFNFVGDGLHKARQYLTTNGLNLTQWDRTQAASLAGVFSAATAQ